MEIIKGSGNNKVELQIKNLRENTQRAIRKAFYEIGKDLVRDTHTEIDRMPKHGRVYRTKIGREGRALKRSRDHIASAPGEAPAIITGTLKKSINFQVHGANEMEFGVDLSRGEADYGEYLEYKNLISMSGEYARPKPRPYISAAYKKNIGNMVNKFNESLKKEITK